VDLALNRVLLVPFIMEVLPDLTALVQQFQLVRPHLIEEEILEKLGLGNGDSSPFNSLLLSDCLQVLLRRLVQRAEDLL